MRNLVLLPGFMCDSDLWRDVAPDLGKLGPLHYGNVYQDDTLEGMAEHVLSEAPERFVLIGFSMGGFVARVLTLMAPGRVTGVAVRCQLGARIHRGRARPAAAGRLARRSAEARQSRRGARPASRPRTRSCAAGAAARDAASARTRGARAPVGADPQGRLCRPRAHHLSLARRRVPTRPAAQLRPDRAHGQAPAPRALRGDRGLWPHGAAREAA